MKRNKSKNTLKTNSAWKNEAKLKLLTLLPQFQKDVRGVRKEFNIPNDGFRAAAETQKWYSGLLKKSDNMTAGKSFKNKMSPLTEKIRGTTDLKKYFELENQKKKLENTIPLHSFHLRLGELGKKYHLPGNFYFDPDRDKFSPAYGVMPYVLRNIIAPPPNDWAIESDVSGGGLKGTSCWVSLQTFAPLNKKEFRNAIAFLKTIWKRSFPPEITSLFKTRRKFERDLEIFKELSVARTRKPKKRKSYKKGGYLDQFLRQYPFTSPKRLKELERLNPGSIETGYDTIISRVIAEKFNTTPEAIRKAKERMEKLAKQMFGGGQ